MKDRIVNIVSRGIGWVSGLFFLLIALASDGLGSLIFGALGLFLLPPVRRRLTGQLGITISRLAIVGVVIVTVVSGTVLLWGIGASGGADENEGDSGEMTPTPSAKESNAQTTASPTTKQIEGCRPDPMEIGSRDAQAEAFFDRIQWRDQQNYTTGQLYVSPDPDRLWVDVTWENTRDKEDIAREIPTFARVYAAVVDAGYGAERLQVHVTSEETGDEWEFLIRSEWARSCLEDRMSKEEYLDKAVSTIEEYEDCEEVVCT